MMLPMVLKICLEHYPSVFICKLRFQKYLQIEFANASACLCAFKIWFYKYITNKTAFFLILIKIIFLF